jgi:hypothetical protein
VVEPSTPSAWSALNLGVIDLDAIELPSNDEDIYEAMLERTLANPVESGIEAPEAATSAAATSADTGASSSGVLVPAAAATEQPTPDQGGDVGDPVPSVVSEAAEGSGSTFLSEQISISHQPPAKRTG